MLTRHWKDSVHLNHETDENALFGLQACQHRKNFAPTVVAREVVVREEVAVDAMQPVVLTNGVFQCLNRPERNSAPLHVNDSAETAVVWSAPAAVNRTEVRSYETLTWNPPIKNCNPPARKRRAISAARGNWLDWTPTSATTVLQQGSLLDRTILSAGIFCTV